VTCATKTQKRVVMLRDSLSGDTSNVSTEALTTRGVSLEILGVSLEILLKNILFFVSISSNTTLES
jgi:hypothetical protein